MAAIANLSTLTRVLTERASSKPAEHVWIAANLGLVVGKFPEPVAIFDFVAEEMIPLSAEHHTPKRVDDRRTLAKRTRDTYEIETTETIFRFASATQALVDGLEILEELSPGTLDKLCRMKKKRSKRPVARSHEELYDVHHPTSHSVKLANGFFVATNNKALEAVWVLRDAAKLSGVREFAVRGPLATLGIPCASPYGDTA